jgi:hypothetical protein
MARVVGKVLAAARNEAGITQHNLAFEADIDITCRISSLRTARFPQLRTT